MQSDLGQLAVVESAHGNDALVLHGEWCSGRAYTPRELLAHPREADDIHLAEEFAEAVEDGSVLVDLDTAQLGQDMTL